MQSSFQQALSWVLLSEGGFVNNPYDPGGATNMGVIQLVYSAWRRLQGKPPQSVRYITRDEAAAIYKAQYWDAVRGDDLPPGVDYCVFDEAVNSGPVRAIQALQRVISCAVDGHFGMLTMDAVKMAMVPSPLPNRPSLIDRYCDERLSFLHRLRTWQFFGRGWTARVQLVRKNAKSLEGK